MQASVHYDDFVGTAAADISDHTDLNKHLKSRGFDTNRYESIGAKFYAIYSDSFSASIICIDKQKSTEEKPYIVAIKLEKEFSRDDFFELFKSFEVIVTLKETTETEIIDEIDSLRNHN